MTNYEVVKKLIGPIKPIGESHADTLRFSNLEEMCALVNTILRDISDLANERERNENSISRAGHHARKFLLDLQRAKLIK